MIKTLLALVITLCLSVNTNAQVAVAVGGNWGGVAVATGGYAGYGYYGGYVAPIGGWYPYYYTSSFYASPVPQIVPIAQPVGPYTVSPCYVQPVQQQVIVRQRPCTCQPRPCN